MADNIADLRDKQFVGDKYRSVTARNKALAEASGVSKNQIGRIIATTQGTTVDQLEWLASALGVRPQDLVTPYFTRAQNVTPLTPKRGKAKTP